jgi:predicted MFS family arabinose efflux permease
VRAYREVLRLPGVRSLILVGLLARIPSVSAGVTLTLHVVLDLDRGYAAAGLVGAAATIGAALGAPLLGRIVDRRGLRPVLVLTTIAEALFWSTAGALPYPILLVAALVGGLLLLPTFSVIRQSLAALVPEEQRRPAYALDSMSVEVSFMIGPALAVLLATTVSPRATMYAVGGGIVLAGLLLFVLNPPIRAAHEEAPSERRVPLRSWLTPRMVGILAISVATTLVLGGTDVAVVAVLREAGQVQFTGLVLAAWGVYSLAGGFAYGAVRRAPPPVVLLLVLGLFTIPVGFAGDQWWLVAIALLPAGALCAPTLASAADAVSRLAPPEVRGLAMGVHGSAITVGLAVGAPLAGAVIDASAPAWGFVATGLVGTLVALIVLPLELRRRSAAAARDAEPAPGAPVEVHQHRT